MYKENIKININYEYGNIQWCDNPKIGKKYAIYFSNTKNKDKQNILLNIEFDFNNIILNKIEYIDIRDDNNKSIIIIKRYNITPIYFLSFAIQDNIRYINIYIVSIKKICYFGLCNKKKYKIIYQKFIDLPNLKILDSDECYICLDNIDYTNYYITPCKHKFHSTCFYKYLEYNKLFIEKNLYCIQKCNHERKNKSFNCPVCKLKI